MTRARIIGGPHCGKEGDLVDRDHNWCVVKTSVGDVEVHRGQVEIEGDLVDLKPRNIKRQWWLMPFDALAFAMSANPGEGTVEHALAAYQFDPNPLTISGVFLFLLGRLETYCGGDTFDAPGKGNQALDQIVAVFEYGASKYAPNNWLDPAQDRDAFRREYFSAICRHAFHVQPDPLDSESGLAHVAHAACTALIILTHELAWA